MFIGWAIKNMLKGATPIQKSFLLRVPKITWENTCRDGRQAVLLDKNLKMKVKIYSTPTCPYCRMTKEYLKEKKIAFEDVNVAADKAKAQEMIDRSGQMGVPVVDIDGKLIIGFDKEELEKVFASRKK